MYFCCPRLWQLRKDDPVQRYNAFISYRHCPLDSKIATEIQRGLERFSIPRAIQKSSGKKRISRIFRDKEELSLTEDLNETIRIALEESEYLIVICSPSAKESIWVQKEIEYFLSTHNKKQVLTVIAEGEPCDVLPEILTYEEMTLPDESGGLETVKVPIEPLSCDYRLSSRRAKREELPRLAAAIIGCGYDDLRRRQRQYRMRRWTAAVTVLTLALGFLSTYFAWSAAQIIKNYEQSLVNQTEYLASEARTLLRGGDRLSAMLLSLHALPDEQLDRPVMPSAVNALVQSTYAYVSPGSEIPSLEYMISPDGRIDEFILDRKEKYLAIRHDSYEVDVWDITQGCFTCCLDFSTFISQIGFTDSSGLLVLTGGQLSCYDITGALLWEHSFGSDASLTYFTLTAQNDTVAFYSDSTVKLLNTQTGDEIRSIALPAEYADFTIRSIYFSPDGRNIVFLDSLYADQALICSNNGANYALYTVPDGYISSLCFDENNALYLAVSSDQYSYFTDGQEDVYSVLNGSVLKLDLQGTVLWKTPAASYHESQYAKFFLTEYTTDSGPQTAVMYCYSNLCCLFDTETGELRSRVEFLGSVIDAQPLGAGIRCILSTGELAVCNPSASVVSSTPCFVRDNYGGILGERLYILDQSKAKILVYRSGIYDDSWQTCYTPQNNRYYRCTKGIFFPEKEYSLHFLGGDHAQISWSVETQVDTSRLSVLGVVDDGKTAVLSLSGEDKQGENKNALCLIELDSGAQEYLYLEDIYSYQSLTLSGNRVYYHSYYYDTSNTLRLGLRCLDIKTGEFSALPLSFESAPLDTICVSPSEETVLVWDARGQCTALHQGSEQPLGAPMADDYVSYHQLVRATWTADGSLLALTGRESIDLYDAQLNPLCQIPMPEKTVGWIEFYNDTLLILCGGTVYCHSADGSLLAEVELVSDNAPFDCTIVAAGQNNLAILVNDDLNLIDTSCWQCFTTVAGCLNYDALSGCIFTVGTIEEEEMVGYYTQYPLQELMELAKTQLGGLELTEEQKSQYGLS